MAVSVPDFLDWRTQTTTMSGLVASFTSDAVLTGTGEPQKLSQSRVSANLFDVLGARPVIGRAFRRGEDDATAPRVAMISESMWRTKFGGDSSVIGRNIILD